MSFSSMLTVMTPGLSGCILLGHTALTKLLMTLLWRGPGSKAAKLGADNWMQVKDKLDKEPFYQIMHAVQLNEAEYAGPFIAALLFLSAKNVEAPIACSLAVFGQLFYYWPRIFMANPKTNFNNGMFLLSISFLLIILLLYFLFIGADSFPSLSSFRLPLSSFPFPPGFPYYVPAALARYASLFLLTYAIYGVVA